MRLAAAAAVARLKPPAILADLLAAASRNTLSDALVRSSLAHALAEAVPAAAIAEAAQRHPLTEVRLTAVLALRRTAAPETADFLSDSDPLVTTEAARAVYDLPLRPAFPRLAGMLGLAALTEPAQRRALAAAVYLGSSADADRVAGFATAPDISSILRSTALTALESWNQPAPSDPLWNRPETALPRLPGVARTAARGAAEALRHHADLSLAAQALKLWKATAPLSAAARLHLVNDSGSPEPDRLASLLSLMAANELSQDDAKALTLPTNSPPRLRAEARSLLMRREPKTASLILNEALTTGGTAEKQAAIRMLDRLPSGSGDHERPLLELTKSLGTGGIEPGIQVEVLEALQRRDTESRSPWRRASEAWQASLSLNVDPLAAWRMTMEDGDPASGRLIFETHPEAGCLSCHSTNGIGGLRGPDLDGVADRLTKGGLLESLIQPGAKLAQGYAGLADPPAPDRAAAGDTSIMPPMGTLLTLRELRDLIAYLRTLKAS